MLTREQFREARRLLRLEQAHIALAAVTTREMVWRMESGFGVTPQVRGSVTAALIACGIEFGRDGTVRLLDRREPLPA